MSSINPRETQFSPDKIFFHDQSLEAILLGKTTYPSVYEVSPVGYCNQKCVYCVSQDFRDKARLRNDQYDSLLTQIAELGGQAITITGGGEPLLHPEIDQIIRKATSLSLSVGIITNGTYKTSSYLSDIIANQASFCRFSLDTIDPKQYKAVRGTNHLKHVVENVELLVASKSRLQTKALIGVQIVWINQKFSEVTELTEFFYQRGVDFVQIRPVDNIPFFDNSPKINLPDGAKEFLTSLQNQYNCAEFKVIPSESKWNEVFHQETGKKYVGCRGANLTASIGHDYKVYFCCSHIGNPLFCLGDLSQFTLRQILESPLRKRLIEGVDHKMCQMQCRNHHLNNKIHELQAITRDKALSLIKDAVLRTKPQHWEFL